MTTRIEQWYEAGNIAIRNIFFSHVGDSVPIHYHNFHHVLFCILGTVHAYIYKDSGDIEISRILGPGDSVLVDATKKHSIVSLTDNAKAACIFAARNPQGEVIDECNGWEEAYANRANPPTPEILRDLALGKDTHGQ